LGAHLKSLIARKTVAYVGYSLSDENYLRLLGNIARMMGDKTRQSYFISPQIDADRIRAAPVPLIPIETDGAFFFEEVRRTNGDALGITAESAFYCCLKLLDEVATIHDKTATAFLKTNHPLLIFALSYQDGLSHALRRIIRMKKTGEYHSINSVHSRVHTYAGMAQDYIKHENFWDAAYCLGYHNGLLYLLLASQSQKAPNPPFFEMPFDVTVGSLKEIAKRPRDKLPRKVVKFLREMMRDFPKKRWRCTGPPSLSLIARRADQRSVIRHSLVNVRRRVTASPSPPYQLPASRQGASPHRHHRAFPGDPA